METKRHPLTVFVDRLKKIGVNIKLVGNYPWVYVESINGINVTEKYHSNHCFTIALLPIKNKDSNNPFEIFTDITEIFNLIRKYTHYGKDNLSKRNRVFSNKNSS